MDSNTIAAIEILVDLANRVVAGISLVKRAQSGGGHVTDDELKTLEGGYDTARATFQQTLDSMETKPA